MPEYSIGDKVILKDDGQLYTVMGVRKEEGVVLFDLEKGHDQSKIKVTVLRSQIQVQKAYSLQYPQTVVYSKRAKFG